VLFYRIARKDPESERPHGPYRVRYMENRELVDFSDEMSDSHSNNDHPSPTTDENLWYIDDEEVCGFTDMFDLNNWFDGWFERLHEFGYKLFVYETPRSSVRQGVKQAVAVYDDSDLVGEFPLMKELENAAQR
jgi:hypothetical protein